MLAVYGLSLSILELVASIFSQGLETEFQRGHTAISAFWGLLGLALLYAGLKRWRPLRIAGFALFAVSLGKIGGFFYRHLSAADEPNGATS